MRSTHLPVLAESIQQSDTTYRTPLSNQTNISEDEPYYSFLTSHNDNSNKRTMATMAIWELVGHQHKNDDSRPLFGEGGGFSVVFSPI